MPEMTPERLDYIEDCARRTHWLDDGDGKRTLVEASREDVRDLCAEIRRLTAERDAAVSRAENGLRRENALATEIVALTEARERLTAECDGLTRAVVDLTGQVRSLQSEVDTLHKRPLRETADRLQAERDASRECVARSDERAEAHEGHAHHLEGVVEALTAERDAAAQAEATLREALGHIMLHLHGGIPLATYEEVARWPARMIIEKADRALATPPTAYARLAQAQREYIAAVRAEEAHLAGSHPTPMYEEHAEWAQRARDLRSRRERAWDALVEAEEAAGVKRDA